MDAQSERQTSIYSPPFYSSSTGYKMRARLYMNGDGNARHSHMSLFFVLMRGRHDAVLKFPFAHKVIFCLYDQTASKRHLVDSFRPDIRSNSFQRARSDMNIASGIPKFCPLNMIKPDGCDYVQNDTMFIRIKIDFEESQSPEIDRFEMELDPGLPEHVRKDLTRKEAHRRKTEHDSERKNLNRTICHLLIH